MTQRTSPLCPWAFAFQEQVKAGVPPRPVCVTTWRSKILATLPNIDLNLIIGRYAIDWHAPEHSKSSVSEAAKDWKAHWPHRLILSHPSPRNNRWLKTNPWFEGEILPQLQARVANVICP